MKVVYSPQAIENLQAYLQYVAPRNPAAARRVAQRILTTIDLLARGAFEGPEKKLRSGEMVQSWPVQPLRI